MASWLNGEEDLFLVKLLGKLGKQVDEIHLFPHTIHGTAIYTHVWYIYLFYGKCT